MKPQNLLAAMFARLIAPPAVRPIVYEDADGNRLVRIRRNAPCPCGSGRKFKVCCHPRNRS